MSDRALRVNVMQRGDALGLLRSLPEACTPLVFFDPQHLALLDKLKFGNEGARQTGRARLPAMSDDYVDSVCLETARVLKPSGYLMRWIDTFCLCEGHHLRIPRQHITPVDLNSWDSLHLGMGLDCTGDSAALHARDVTARKHAIRPARKVVGTTMDTGEAFLAEEPTPKARVGQGKFLP